MYTVNERNNLLDLIINYMQDAPEFEVLLQIGSGVTGYRDIYSDIDLMAGCYDEKSVISAQNKLVSFFTALNSVYIDKRYWASDVRGLSVCFENGLSVDLSLMPSKRIQLLSNEWKILFAVNDESITQMQAVNERTLGDSIYHKLIYALRKSIIAVRREDYVYADMMLSEAREYLLLIEANKEGKKLHQFKAYHTLSERFLNDIEGTYPVQRSAGSIEHAWKNLLNLFLSTVEGFTPFFDTAQLKLLCCFDDAYSE